jgi:GNAT superfamily N-acetyltransferase
MSITVRQAIGDDAAAACEVLRRSIRELCVADHQNDEKALGAWLENKTIDNVRAWIASPGNYAVVAVRDADICGFALLARDGTLRACYLVPEVQRLGVGKAMLSALEREASRWGLRSVQLESTLGATSFYEYNGYVRRGEPVLVFEVQRAYPMQKVLAL